MPTTTRPRLREVALDTPDPSGIYAICLFQSEWPDHCAQSYDRGGVVIEFDDHGHPARAYQRLPLESN